MNSIWFVSTAKKNYEKTCLIGSRPQTKASSPNGQTTLYKFLFKVETLRWRSMKQR